MWNYAVMSKLVKKIGGPTKALVALGVSQIAITITSYHLGKAVAKNENKNITAKNESIEE